jgi:hypothetical protein
VGPGYFASWDAIEGIADERVVNAVADVVSGRADTMHTWELHQLRTGAGAEDPPVRRTGGETCWRLSLQQHSPSARRLHFWRRGDGSIELSSIRVHDDMRP